MTLKGSATAVLDASPDDVFALVTDVRRLTEWNRIIVAVDKYQDALEPGAEWVVTLRAMGNSWRSRSRVERVDATAREFAYRSQTDDGNASFGIWTWHVTPAPTGARVTVGWDLHPQTFWRRVLLAPMRNRQLRREVCTSLNALETTIAETNAPK